MSDISKLSIIILGFSLFSCEKEKDIQEPEPYIELWQEFFIHQNKMSPTYFTEHIEILSEERLLDEYGEYFKVEYGVKFDWFEAALADSFMILINDKYQ
ncbi:MAG: hypothetical protein JXR10_12620 [Cyclobacteriaceae bacterium]